MDNKKILLIEDDKNLVKYMTEYLTAYEYKVSSIIDFDNVLEEITKEHYNLILLDINLPRFDGFYFLKLIKTKNNIPIIIVSSRSEEAEQIRGIDLGADDYIVKPFSMGILLAKINAVLRRVNGSRENSIKIKEIELMCEGMELKNKDKKISLSKNEYKLIKLFFENYGKVVTREELLDNLWDDDEFVDDNTLTVNITRLKKMFKENEIDLEISTKRGIGYVIK